MRKKTQGSAWWSKIWDLGVRSSEVPGLRFKTEMLSTFTGWGESIRTSVPGLVERCACKPARIPWVIKTKTEREREKSQKGCPCRQDLGFRSLLGPVWSYGESHKNFAPALIRFAASGIGFRISRAARKPTQKPRVIKNKNKNKKKTEGERERDWNNYSARSPNWRKIPTSPETATPSRTAFGSSLSASLYSSGCPNPYSFLTWTRTRGILSLSRNPNARSLSRLVDELGENRREEN